jgi:hypothetical protein
MAKSTKIVASVPATTAKATKAATPAKAKRADAATLFAAKLAKVKSTGNASLDTALTRIVTAIRVGEATVAQAGEGFAGVVGKAKFQVSKVVAGKATRYVLNIGEPGKGMEIAGAYAAIAFRQAGKRFKPAAAAASYDAAKVAELAKLLGL